MKQLSFSQIAGMNMHYSRYSFGYFLDSLQQLGLTQYELWAGAPHFCYPVSAGAPAKEIADESKRRGLKIVCVTPEQCIYPYNIASAQKEFRQASIDYFCGWIYKTAEMGVKYMLCGPGWGLLDQPLDEAWKLSVDALSQMTRLAQKVGVTLAFEILLPNESNLVNNLETTVRMMQEIDDPAFRCCIDTVPVCKEGKTLRDYYEKLGSKIVHIHLNDGTPTGHMTWGDGNQPLAEHLQTLDEYGYDGAITLELGAGRYYEKPQEHLARGLGVLQQAFKNG